jgi:glycosyltransferase involved in cell wall biosynthesis
MKCICASANATSTKPGVDGAMSFESICYGANLRGYPDFRVREFMTSSTTFQGNGDQGGDPRVNDMTTLGVVVIGRNEGDRLKRCLDSVQGLSDRIVYVDSGSTDGSIDAAKARRATVVELDMRNPFTAGRARNEGFKKLIQMRPSLDYVFFVDGDCEVVPGWLDKARQFLDEHRDVAVISGLRRERHPEKSLYNLLIDMEWRGYPFGETRICGGDALMRVSALRQVDGYRAELICGEEPEMCVRLRKEGWRIWRLDEPMALHDAAMYRFGQWWKRQMRAGYAYAQGASLHGARPERHGVSECRRAWIWGFGIPLMIVILAVVWSGWTLALLALYPAQLIRIALRGKSSMRENWLRSGALILGKFPEVVGQAKFLSDRFRGLQSRLIEYK